MLRFIIRRVLQSIPVLLGVSILVFLMLHLVPGDPVQVLLGEQGLSQEAYDRLEQELGLNRPLPAQYADFLFSALRGDLGRSLFTNRPVVDDVLANVWPTLQLTFAAMILAAIMGITLGTISAIRQNSWLDTLSMIVALIGVSMPGFWLGILLIFLFSLKLGWFPATGTGGLGRLVLPALALGLQAAGIIARLVRSSVLEVMRNEYIVTARAKGLAEAKVVMRHTLKNALIPVVTIMGLQFGTLLGGAVVIENVFSRPGVGRLIVDAILQKDFPLVQGGVLFAATMYVVANLLVDISYAWLDPRIKFQ